LKQEQTVFHVINFKINIELKVQICPDFTNRNVI
jgi:hypothetical protein